MASILVPFLFIRVVQGKKGFLDFFQDLFIISEFALLCRFDWPWNAILWSPLLVYQLLGWFSLRRFNIPFSRGILEFLRHPKSFFDSIKATRTESPIFLGLLLCALSVVFFPNNFQTKFWIYPFAFSACVLYIFRKKIDLPNPLFELHSKLLFDKKNPIPQRSPPFPHEISKVLSPDYPVLRKTFSFLGKKRFDVPLKSGEKPHLIFVFLESFRAKNVGCLGAKIGASPHFDRWAEKGFLFRNFHVNGLQTYRAFLAAYFGIHAHLRTVSLKPFCSLSLRGLPQILKEQGYHPAIIQSGDLSFDSIYPFFRTHGFETVYGCENIPVSSPRSSSWGLDDEAMVRFAADWLQRQTSPAFLSLFTITNHHPWKKPLGWDFPVDPSLSSSYRDFLQTFSYTDHCLGVFLDTLKKSGLLEQSILFIAGDHGQEIGERGGSFDVNHTLFEENIHVPLLILAEGRGGGRVFDNAASFVDLPPTVCDLLRLQPVHHSLGNSLLRDIDSPAFFSLQMKTTEIGWLEGKKKTIGKQLFDLEKDPEEKFPSPSTSNLASSFFASVEAIFEKKAWAPKSMQEIPDRIAPPKDTADEEWLSLLHRNPPTPIVDLSACFKITDRALLEADPKRAGEWHQLSLNDSPLVSDRSLHWIGENCPNLMFLNLSHCPLLSDEGLSTLLRGCKKLRYLWLEGVEELVDFSPSDADFNLFGFSLREARRVRGKCLARLFLQSPSLYDWAASLESVEDADLFKMGEASKECAVMVLTHGREIHDTSFSRLLAAQPRLLTAALEDFPHLERPDFSSNKDLCCLSLSDCPRLGDGFLDTLKDLPLRRLILRDCPLITPSGLRKLAGKSEFQTALSNCPGVSPEAIHALRLDGVNIY